MSTPPRPITFTLYKDGDRLGVQTFEGDKLKIGCLKVCQLRLEGSDIGRIHALVERRGDALVLSDFGARGGTRLNGHLVEEAPLSPGDRVRIGTYELVVGAEDEPAEEEDEPAGSNVLGLDIYLGGHLIDGRQLELPFLTVGSDPSCDLQLEREDGVQRLHAVLSCRGPLGSGRWGVQDMAPCPTTFIDGEPPTGWTPISPGAALQLGRIGLRVADATGQAPETIDTVGQLGSRGRWEFDDGGYLDREGGYHSPGGDHVLPEGHRASDPEGHADRGDSDDAGPDDSDDNVETLTLAPKPPPLEDEGEDDRQDDGDKIINLGHHLNQSLADTEEGEEIDAETAAGAVRRLKRLMAAEVLNKLPADLVEARGITVERMVEVIDEAMTEGDGDIEDIGPIMEELFGDSITIVDTPEALEGLRGVTHFEGTIDLRQMQLDDLSALAELEEAREIFIGDIDGLGPVELPALRRAHEIVVGALAGVGRIAMPALQDITARFVVAECPDLEVLELPALRRIGGVAQIRDLPGLASLTLPALEELGGAFLAAEMIDLESVELPSLVRCRDDLVISEAPNLSEVKAPALVEVEGKIGLTHLPRLGALELPRLETIAETLHTVSLDALHELDLPALIEVGGRVSLHGDGLKSIDAPSLESIGGDLLLGNLSSLEAVELPELRRVGGQIGAVDLTSLRTLELPMLRHVDGRAIFNQLPVLTRVDLRRLESVGGSLVLGELPELTTLNLTRLSSVERLRMRELPALPDDAIATVLYGLFGMGYQGNLDIDRDPSSLLSNKEGAFRVAPIDRDVKITAGTSGDLSGVPTRVLVKRGVTISGVEDPVELALARHLWRVAGDLMIGMNGPGVRDLELPELWCVGGNLDLSMEEHLEVLRLPNLERVEGSVRLARCSALRRVELPNLERVEGDLLLGGDGRLVEFHAPRLRHVGGDLQTSDCGALGSLALPALKSVDGGLHIVEQASLGALDLPALQSVGADLMALGLLALRDITLPRLTGVGALKIGRCDELQLVSAPACQRIRGSLAVYGLSALRRVDLSALESIDGKAGLGQCRKLGALDLSSLSHVDGVLAVVDTPSLDAADQATLREAAAAHGFELLLEPDAAMD